MKAITLRFKIWQWTTLKMSPVTTLQVMKQFKIPMTDASRFLSRLYGDGCMRRERIKNIRRRFEYSPIIDNPPQKTMGNPQAHLRPFRGSKIEQEHEINRVFLRTTTVYQLVCPEFLLLARQLECLPLVRITK